MHEYFDVEEYERFLVVQAQVALFVLCYHSYLGVQSLWQCAIAAVAVVWLYSEITNVTSIVAALLGLLLAVLTVYATKIKHDKIHYQQLFYFLVQPAVFYYTMRLYVEQTMYPVGIPLTFILWLAMNMSIWTFTSHSYAYYLALGVPVFSIFFFAWIFDKIAWLALGLGVGAGMLHLLMQLTSRRLEKINRKK